MQEQVLRTWDAAAGRLAPGPEPLQGRSSCRPYVDACGSLAWSGSSTALSPAEGKLLGALLEAQSRVVSRDQLAAIAATDARHGLDAHMYRLRQKLSALPGLALETVPKRGFRLVVPPIAPDPE